MGSKTFQSLTQGVSMKKALTTAFIVAFSTLSFAQKTSALLVSPSALAGELKDHKLVLLEMSGMGPAPAQLIPGTRLVSMDDVATPMDHNPSALMLELLPANVLRDKLAALGISDDSRIVVYSDSVDPMSFSMTTRLIFTLEYLGLGSNTALLNGGFPAWKKQGLPVTTTALAKGVKPGHLTPRPVEPIVADATLVSSIGTMAGYKLVDARAPAYYKGVEPSMGQSGHIPGAVNVPFTDVVDSNGVIDLSKISTIFREAGIKPGDTVVTYCHVGAQATSTLFAARLLGNPVMLYDGSWQDWTMNHRGPVVK